MALSIRKYSIFSLSLIMVLILGVVASRASSTVSMDAIHQLIEQADYDAALSSLRDTKMRIDCDNACLAEVLFLTGYCRFRLGHGNAALEELQESLRLRPQFRINEADYPRGFVEFFERARSEVLCTVEIQILTPHLLGLRVGNEISTLYRAEDVPANWIELRGNKYGPTKRHKLLPGQLNRFELELQELRDYHSFDSLHLSFRPAMNGFGRGSWAQDSTEALNSCVEIGDYCVELLLANYYPRELSQIVLEGEWSSSVIMVLEAKAEWTKLHKNLASNPNRRLLTRVLKVTSIVGCAAAAVWAVQADSDADARYEDYLIQVSPVDIARVYREHKKAISTRNIMGAFSLALAATGIISYIFAPRNERDLIEAYEEQHRASGIALEVKANYIGMRIPFDF